MDQEQLRELVITQKPDDFVQTLAPLSEKERKALSVFSYKLYREIDRGEIKKDTHASLKELFKKIKQTDWNIRRRAHYYPNSILAVIALSSLTNAKKVHLWQISHEKEHLLDQVIRDRKPEWLTDWVNAKLDEEFIGISWNLLRGWIRDGLCEKPTSPGYINLFSYDIKGWRAREKDKEPLSHYLRSDPDLLKDEVWKLFEVETQAFKKDWMETSPNAPKNYESWPRALITLANEGLLDRQRLLDEGLAALSREFEAHYKSGFHKFHLSLEPTLDEISQRKAVYLDLLNQPTGHVVGFALKMLRTLEKGKLIDAKALLSYLQTVLMLQTKSQPIALLRMIKRLAKNDAAAQGEIVSACVDALSHQHSDVQELVLTILEEWGDSNPMALDTAQQYVEMISTPLQARLMALAPSGHPESGDVEEQADFDLSELGKMVSDLDSPLRRKLGLDQYLEFDKPLEFPPPLESTGKITSVLAFVEPIQALQSVDELLDCVAHAVEVVDGADEVERILDGISRFCDQRPKEFSLRTDALAKRVANPQQSETARGLISTWGGVPLVINDLLHTWLTNTLHRSPGSQYYKNEGIFLFFEKRVRELINRVHKGIAAPLLSAPTHVYGWIDPAVFIERVLSLTNKGIDLPRYDFLQALLRLMPDNREQALVAAMQIKGDEGRIIRWALGAGDGPKAQDKKDADLWITASRARDSKADFTTTLSVLQVKDLLPDTIVPSSYHWTSGIRTTEAYGNAYTFPDIKIQVGGGNTDNLSDEPSKSKVGVLGFLKGALKIVENSALDTASLPTYLLTTSKQKQWWENVNLSSGWQIHWTMMTWPSNIDASLMRAVKSMVIRMDDNASSYQPNYAFLEPVFYGYQPWSEMCMLALWAALVGKDADARGLAVDLLIEGIEDGRVHPHLLSDILIRLAKGGWIKTNRLTDSLQQVSQVSPLHKLICAMMIERLLISQTELPTNAHFILELLLSLLTELQKGPNENLKELLNTQKGSSKKAKLAKAIINLPVKHDSSMQQAAISQAILTRVQHAPTLLGGT